MSTANMSSAVLKATYAKAAEDYLHSLPLEHFMEATAQATQRKITLESLDLVHARRPEVQLFSELLVQYRYGRPPRLRQVVPDNMVVIWSEPIDADGSYDVPLQPVKPFWTLEYVSKSRKRKDYQDSYQKYERELKVPYYLIFDPDKQHLTLYHHGGRKYRPVPANEHGRYLIGELDLEVGLLDGWVRFWYQGQLLPLPADLQQQKEEAEQRAEQERQRAEQEKRRADRADQRAGQERRRAEQERQAKEAADQRADQERQRADQERQRAEQERQAKEAAVQRADQERQLRQALERELEWLRARAPQPAPRPEEVP